MEKLTLAEALHWRYAAKRMTGEKLSPQNLKMILEAIRLAPTSRGIQSFKILVIDNDLLKKQIQPIADNQPQIVECSHLLIFASWTSISLNQIEEYINHVAIERGIGVEKLEKMKSVLLKDQLQMNSEEFYQWTSKQIYLALGFALASAAVNKIDAAAMEGFSAQDLDKLLQLDKMGLRSVVLLGLGYRDIENDWLLKLKKIRRSKEELFIYL